MLLGNEAGREMRISVQAELEIGSKKNRPFLASFLSTGLSTGACRAWLLLVLISASVGLLSAQTGSRQSEGNAAVQTQIQNVRYHFRESATVTIKTLSGELLPTEGSEFPVFR